MSAAADPRSRRNHLAAQARAIASLPAMGTPFTSGAVPLNPLTTLTNMAALSSVQAQLAEGLPDAYSLEQYIRGVYKQGAGPGGDPHDYTCVPYSAAAMLSIFCQAAYGKWLTFDAEECYTAVGGTGEHGVPVTAVLDWARDTGFRDISTGQRHKISSSGVQDPTTPDGQGALKAAIASKTPCLIGLLLPSDFDEQIGGDGNCQSTTVTREFHQVCVFGYDAARFYFLNSQGAGWGANGRGSIPWSVLNADGQPGLAYAATATDTIQPGGAPLFARAVAPMQRTASSALRRRVPTP